MTNLKPTYFATQYWVPATKGNPKIVPNRFNIYEQQGEEVNLVIEGLSNQDRLNQLLKRGIPLEDAKGLFYKMDGISTPNPG